jgi:hypothetical protein
LRSLSRRADSVVVITRRSGCTTEEGGVSLVAMVSTEFIDLGRLSF